MLTEFLQRRRDDPAALLLGGQHFDRAVHADREHLVHRGQIRVLLDVAHVRAVAADRRLHGLTIFRVRADQPRQVEQHQRLVEVDGLDGPALGYARARRLRAVRTRLTTLYVGSETPSAQRDRIAGVVAQQLIARARIVRAVRCRQRPRERTLGVLRAADERTTLFRRAQAEPSRTAARALPRVDAVHPRWIQVWAQHLVDLLEYLADAQVRGAGQRQREISPEQFQHLLPVAITGRDLVELLLEIGSEVVLHVAPEIVREEGGHEPALILGNQPVAVLAHVAALLDRADDGRVGGRAADTELLHPLDQRRLGVARWRLRMVAHSEHRAGLVDHGAARTAHAGLRCLERRCLGRVIRRRFRELRRRGVARERRGLTLADLRQAALVITDRLLVAPLVVDLQEAIEQHDLTGRSQLDAPVSRRDLDRRALQARRGHLACECALPDQFVELALVGLGDAQPIR